MNKKEIKEIKETIKIAGESVRKMREADFLAKCKMLMDDMHEKGISINVKELLQLKELERYKQLALNRKTAIKSLIQSYDRLKSRLYDQKLLREAFTSANERARSFERIASDLEKELTRRRELHAKTLEELEIVQKKLKASRRLFKREKEKRK